MVSNGFQLLVVAGDDLVQIHGKFRYRRNLDIVTQFSQSTRVFYIFCGIVCILLQPATPTATTFIFFYQPFLSLPFLGQPRLRTIPLKTGNGSDSAKNGLTKMPHPAIYSHSQVLMPLADIGI